MSGSREPRVAGDAADGGAPAVDVLDLPQAGPTVIRGGVMRVTGFAAGLAISVVSAVVVLRYLSVADFGRYTQVVALVTIVAGLTDAGMTSIGVRELSVRDRASADDLMRNLLGIRLVLTTLGIAIAMAFAVAVGYTEAMIAGAALAGLALVLQVTQGTIGVPLQSELRLGWVTSLDLLRQCGTAIALVLAVVAGAGLALLLAAPLPIALVLLVLTAWLVRGRLTLTPTFHRSTWRRLLVLTLPFAAATAVAVIYGNVTVVLMSLVSTAYEAGIFSAAFRVFVVIATIPGLLVMSAFPILARAARDDRARLRYAVQRLFEVCLIIGIGAALVTVVGAPTLIRLLAGPRYVDAVEVLQVQGIALTASFFVALGGFALLSLHRHGALLVANLAALVTAVTVTLALAPGYGALGTAYANVAGESVLVVALFLALRRGEHATRISFELAPRVLLAAAVGVAVAFVPLPLPLPAVLAGGAYVGALLALRAVPEEVFDALRRR